MKIYKNLESYSNETPVALTQGTFDGVHLGHCIILEQLRKAAREENCETALLTFFPHPRMIIGGHHDEIKLLHTENEKIKALENAGIDHLLIVPFTREFSEMSPQHYIDEVLVKKLKVKTMVVGYDHHFGKNREGNISLLRNENNRGKFSVREIEARLIEDIAVSSTKIRKALNDGQIMLANRYLGYAYGLQGIVVHGHAMGKELGFPTANISVPESYKLIPADGIYAIRVIIENKTHKGVVSIGMQPTFEGRRHAIEAHILDFSEDIYGKEVRLEFVERIRGELKFDNLDDLIAEIKRDIEKAKGLLQ